MPRSVCYSDRCSREWYVILFLRQNRKIRGTYAHLSTCYAFVVLRAVQPFSFSPFLSFSHLYRFVIDVVVKRRFYRIRFQRRQLAVVTAPDTPIIIPTRYRVYRFHFSCCFRFPFSRRLSAACIGRASRARKVKHVIRFSKITFPISRANRFRNFFRWKISGVSFVEYRYLEFSKRVYHFTINHN